MVIKHQGWGFPGHQRNTLKSQGRPRSLRQAAEEALERDPPQHTWLPEGCEDAPPDRGNLPGKLNGLPSP